MVHLLIVLQHAYYVEPDIQNILDEWLVCEPGVHQQIIGFNACIQGIAEHFHHEHYDEWADSTQLSRISSIADFGPPEEIADCVQFLGSEKAVEKLLRKAMDHGVAISPVQIMELEGLVDEETLTRLAVTAKAPFSADQLEGLEGLIDDEVLFALDKKAGTNLFCEEWDDDWDEEEEDAPKL